MRHYIHSLPGRLRVQSPDLRQASCKAAHLCNALSELKGIRTQTFNQRTGSILVQYDPEQLSAEDILYQMHKAGCLSEQFSHAHANHAQASPVSRLGNTLGHALFGTLLKKGLETSVSSFAKALI